MKEVRQVKGWFTGLSGWLYIPQSKQNETRRNFPDEMEQKSQAISYWINKDPLASWRRLITVLDGMEETKVADSIRSNAEPLTGIVTTACSHVTLYIIPHITLCTQNCYYSRSWVLNIFTHPLVNRTESVATLPLAVCMGPHPYQADSL